CLHGAAGPRTLGEVGPGGPAPARAGRPRPGLMAGENSVPLSRRGEQAARGERSVVPRPQAQSETGEPARRACGPGPRAPHDTAVREPLREAVLRVALPVSKCGTGPPA